MNSAKEAPISEYEAAGECDKAVREHLEWQNTIEYELGDTLDIKTSIALVVIIFLATQSGGFLASHMPTHWHYVQIVSAGCLAVAGVLAVIELFPRTYKAGLSPDEFVKWVGEVKAFYTTEAVSDPERKCIDFLRRKQVEQMKGRFSHNNSINKLKSNLTTASFWFTAVALIANLATLVALSTHWRF